MWSVFFIHLWMPYTYSPDNDSRMRSRVTMLRLGALEPQGVSLRDLVDETRRQRAETLLEKGISISEVAFRIAYSEASAFLHAFRRWHGTSPGAWRASRSA